MKRLISTLLVSVAGFSASVSFGTPNVGSNNIARNQAEVVAVLPSN